MRKLLAAFVLVALSLLGIEKASAQIALDGSNHCVAGANNVTSVSCTLPNVSAGDLITVEFSDRNGYMTSVGDGTNGAYSQIYYIGDPSDPNSSGMAYFANARAGSVTVSIGLSSSDPWAIVSAQAWTGAARSSVLDTGVTQNQASTSGTVANSTCGTAQTPARAGELILAYLVPDNDSSVAPGTNYSLIDTNLYYGNPTFPEYFIQSAPSATNGAFVNDADDWSEGCAAFKPLTVPGAGIINTVAGNGYYGYSGDGGAATGATVAGVAGVSTDSLGKIYLSDSGNNVLRKVSASTGVITTIAGNGTGGYSGDGGPATSAELSWPTGVAADAAGNVYFADNGGAVRKISASTGIISTVAGTGVWGYSGDGGPATSAELSYDVSVAVDSAGNLYIADKYNMRIRKVSAATGIITTIAGNGTAGYSGDGAAATNAELNWPFGVAVDAVGNVFIADLNNNVIRRVDASTGNISTVAGNGTAGYSGDGSAATGSKLNSPYDVAVDAAGNLYISDSGNNVIREVASASQTITTVAGNGTNGFSGDGGPATTAQLNGPWDIATDAQGNIYIADTGNYRVRAVGSSVTEPNATFPTISWSNPASVAYGTALSGSQLNASANVAGTFSYTPALGAVLPAGVQALSVLFTPTDTTHYGPVMATVPLTVTMGTSIVTWAGPSPILYGTALTASQLDATANVPGTFIYTPAMGSVLAPGQQTLSVTFVPTDSIDYTSAVATVNLTVLGMPTSGNITTIAGDGYYGNSGDGGLAINAEMEAPEQIAVDAAGNVYIPDSYVGVIRKLTASTGEISTIAGTGTQGYSGDGGQATNAELNGPLTVALDSNGNIYVADNLNNRIRKITASTGVITTIAGTGIAGYSGDGGAATSAAISSPSGLVFDGTGNLYIADSGNSVVRKVTISTGIITTVAGDHLFGYSGDGGPATSATFETPNSIAFDSSGNFYISDSADNVVRKVTVSTGVISTVAGTGTAGYSGDGGPATSAKLNHPVAVAIDGAGDIFITEYLNHIVRFVSATTGNISTIAGNGTSGYSGDGGPASSAQLDYPYGIALDAAGNLYIGDCGNHRVRLVGGTSPDAVSVSVTPTSASLYAQQTKQFTATVTNTSNTAVRWSISPSGNGSITSSGLYTAPLSVSTRQIVRVYATSQQDPSKSSFAVVTLNPVNPQIVLTANTGGSYLPSQTATVNIDAQNNGGATATSTMISVVNPDNSSLSFGPSSLLSGQNLSEHTNYTIPVVPAPPAPQPLPEGADSSLFDVNLIVNGDAESAPGALNDAVAPNVPGWTRTGNFTTQVYGNCCGFPLLTDPGPSNRGSNFFYGGPSSSSSQASQIIDVSSAGSLIDEGLITYDFSAWLGGFDGQSDNAVVSATFKDSTGNALSEATLGPVTSEQRGGITELALRSTRGLLPPQTRNVTITLVMTRTDGSDNDGYADDLSFRLSGPTSSGIADSNTSAYLATLEATDSKLLPFAIQANWTDSSGQTYGPARIVAQTTEVVPILDVSLSSDSAAISGSSVSYKIAVVNAGHATASAISATVSLPDGTVQPLTLQATSLAPMASTQGMVAYMLPLTQQNGPVAARVAVTWSDAAGNSYGPVLSTTSTNVTQFATLLQNDSLSVAPAGPGPYIFRTPQTFIATLTGPNGEPISGVNIGFTANGVNTSSGSGVTDANGKATFRYSGTNLGIDDVQANINLGAALLTSNGLMVYWVAPVQELSTTTVAANFYAADGTGIFNATSSTPTAFSQIFPTIAFDPPSGIVPNNTSATIGLQSSFVDVTTDIAGNYSGVLPSRAGNGTLTAFQAAFTGSLLVTSPGNVTFTVYSDGGIVFGVGNNAQGTGNISVNPPQSGLTAISALPVMGAYNQPGAPSNGSTFVVSFPGPGNYPYELDYATTGAAAPNVTMASSVNNGLIVPPAGALLLTPVSVTPQSPGGTQTVSVTAIDAMGNRMANQALSITVAGANPQVFDIHDNTDENGVGGYSYVGTNSGTDAVQATSLIDGNLVPSNLLTVQWGSQSTGGASVSISANPSVSLPNALALKGIVTGFGSAFSSAWTVISGPGTVTFDTPNQPNTNASFSAPGVYVLQLAATSGASHGAAQITITAIPAAGTMQGWIGSPTYGSQISCIVPITVGSGENLQSGVLSFYPANDPNNVTILNANTTGSGQIGTFDTTVLNNGTYWITLQATDTTGNSEYNVDLVNVVGNCKPGRVTSTVTDLVVPAKGLAIDIQRTYDTLNASTVGDFGYGWNLSTNVNLTVDPKGDVSFTLGGIRHTFYLTPVFNGFLPYYTPAYTSDPGFHGTLSGNGPGCSDLFDFILPDGSLWYCIDGGLYSPSGYVYTDPNGTQYLMSSSGQLQLIQDKNGNALTITRNGITSSTGLSVPFVRDTTGRITEITDPQGNHYQYSYDSDGNLASVTYPNISQASTYTYDTHHRYLSGTDFRGNSLPTTAYYGTGDTDTNGLPLNGRLKSVTNALNQTTSYAYNLSTNTTTITYPPDGSGNSGTATMVYDTLGDLLVSTDPLGHTTTNTYDLNQNLMSTTDPLGHVTRYTYDTNGNKTSTTYPATATSTNTTSTTTYNQYSEPTQTADELGNTRSFNYDVNFNPQSVTDGLGTLASFAFNTDGTLQSGAVGYDIGSQPSMGSQFTYDTNGNLIARTDALGRTTSNTFDSLGHKLTTTEPLPNSNTSAAAATTTYTYDDFGNVTQTSAPLSRITSSTYDGNGNKISDTDARGNTTTYQYDALNRLILTTYPDTTTASKTYDFRGNVVTETDQAGHVTRHVYDLAGRETSVTRAYGTSNATTTSYTYDNAGRKLTETDALGHTTIYSYDAAGNLTSVSGVGGSFTYAYDNARNRVSATDGNGHTTGYVYDARKRLVETDYPDGTKKTNAYDGPGNLVSVTDQADNVVEYTYDAANQLKNVVQASSPNSGANTTIVGYDANGNPIVLQDANLHVTASSFDLANELTAKTLPDSTLTESRSYDPAGNLLSVTHFNGVTTTYTYDTLNRLLARATPGETTVSFTYTATGKRHTMTDSSGTTTYGYDAMDRLTSKAAPEGTLTYTYDSAGNLASMSSNHTNGVSLSYTYDSLNRLSTVVDNRLSGSNTTTYTYDDASNVATVTYPNGVQSTFAYDDLNRVTGLSSQLGNYTYQLGPAGNRTSASEPSGRSVTWSYDGIYRLTNEAITGAPSGKNGTVAYGLDPVGNRTSASSSISGLAPVSGTFNPDDELSSETYDQNGNVLSEGGKTFTYDAENHLMSMGSTIGLMYAGDGNRVAKSVSGTTTYYLVDDLNPTGYPQVVEELNSSGAVTRQYSYGLQRISQQQAISNTWTSSFYGYDGGGSVRALTNNAGTVTDTYDYDAFGNKINSTGSTPNSYLYRGEYFDGDLSLYYLRARWINPITGRFMSKDPNDGHAWDPRSLHKYLYAAGDPINLADPLGRASILEVGSLDALVGTTPVPALVELAGGAYASAAAWATNQYLLYAASTINVAAAVSDFVEAVDWAELTSGISKAYLCLRLEDFLFDKLYSAIDMEGYNAPDMLLEEKAKDKFEDACWVLAGKAL